MKTCFLFLFSCFIFLSLSAQVEVRTGLELNPDHYPQEGEPKGELKGQTVLAVYTRPV